MGLVRWLFGEAGIVFSQWLIDNILWFGIPIITFAIIYRYDPKMRLKKLIDDLYKKWRKTKWAIPEEERRMIDEHKNRVQRKYFPNRYPKDKESKQ